MKILPSKDEFLQLTRKGNLIPIYADLMADFETPVSVYSKLSQTGPAYLLESIEGGANLNRYSFIGCQPRLVIRVDHDGVTFTDRDGSVRQAPTLADPLRVIEEEMARYQPVALENMPRFVGGAVGSIGYEYIHYIEPTVPLAAEDPHKMPVLHFMISDTLVAFDRARQTLRLIANVHVKNDPLTDYKEGVRALESLAATLHAGRKIATIPVSEPDPVDPPPGNFTRSGFENLVERCKEYIRAGDAIQIVGSQRFEKPFTHDPLQLYRALRVVNPSPYMFLYNAGDFALIGASPEVHVRLTNGLAELRPIAGTRPRGKTTEEDLANEKDLLADEKERAEHLMLVDLARNDLGRVCSYGSVKVPEYMVVERYSHVMHIVSQVEGRIAGERNAYDLMRATFPAGTVSGAPKIRAMQIIAEIEKDRRGPYAGALTYFSFDGNLDSCICIRTALLKDNTLYIQSGAGLVADSLSSSEFEETLNKARGMLNAVNIAEKMPDF